MQAWLGGWLERGTARRALRGDYPLRLGRGQVFILPTRFGLLGAGVVVVLLMLALNYQNAPVFLLAFLLAALGSVSMVAAHRHLRGLDLLAAEAAPVFAGARVTVRVRVTNPSRRRRLGLACYRGSQRGAASELDAGAQGELALRLPARARGRYRLDGLGLESREPFGVFRAWCRLGNPVDCYVYPSPAPSAPPPPGRATGAAAPRGSGQPEDYAGLVRYRPGNRPGEIAWQVYARTGALERKNFGGGGAAAEWLDLARTPGTDTEARLSVLARWLIDAERGADVYGLRLPGLTLAPGRGRDHLARCLRALAAYPGPYDGGL